MKTATAGYEGPWALSELLPWTDLDALFERSAPSVADLERDAYNSILRGSLCYLRKDWDGAQQAFEQALKAGSEAGTPRAVFLCADASFNLGLLFHAIKDAGGSRRALEQADRLGRDIGTLQGLHVSVKAVLCLGALFHELGDAQQAENAYQTVIELSAGPNAPEFSFQVVKALTHLGSLYGDRGEMEAAREAWNRAIAAGQDAGVRERHASAHASAYLGILHMDEGDEGMAEIAFKAALQLGQGDGTSDGRHSAALAGLGLGTVFGRRGDHKAAEEVFDLAIRAAQKAATPFAAKLVNRIEERRQEFTSLTDSSKSAVIDDMAQVEASSLAATANPAFEPTPQDGPNTEYNPQVVRDLIRLLGISQNELGRRVGAAGPSVVGWLRADNPSPPNADYVIAFENLAREVGWQFSLSLGLTPLPETALIP